MHSPPTQQLTFRVILQGELSPELLGGTPAALENPESFLALNIKPVFDDGEPADPSILDVVGGTEGPQPCIQLRSRLGGVRYRLRTVSKRLGNRGIGVIVEVVGCAAIAPLQSETTMVFSKRKNKEQRLEEQARERSELLERQRAAASLLNTRAIGGPISPSASASPRAAASADPAQYVVRLPVPTKRKSSAHDSDSDASFDSGEEKRAARKRAKLAAAPASAATTRKVEERLVELESAHERLKQEVDYLRGSIHLHLLQNPRNTIASSQTSVAWDFADDGKGGARELLSGMASPPPSRTPLGELETQWGQQTVLRRDTSTSSNLNNAAAASGE